MFEKLRSPFFIVAAVVLLTAIGLEAGTSFLGGKFDEVAMRTQAADALRNSGLSGEDQRELMNQMVASARTSEKPPGMAISYMALLDGLMLFALLVIGLGDLMPRLVGRVQGIVTLVVAILAILAGIVLGLKAFAQLVIMVSLFLSTPFGTLAYLGIWGFFQLGTASAILGASLLLKVVFTIFLMLAQQKFLKSKGLVGIIATSFLACLLIGFLLAYVPGFLASITDALAATAVMLLVIVWAFFMGIFSLPAIIKAI